MVQALSTQLDRWRTLVVEEGLDGWLIADFRGSNPMLQRILGPLGGVMTRRCFLWLPARGEPVLLASQVDGHTYSGLRADLPVLLYRGFDDMRARLREWLPEGSTIAMEYVADGLLPTISRVDGGMIDLVRGFGVRIVSSANMIANEAVWNRRQQELHRRAARGVDETRREVLRWYAERAAAGEVVTEGGMAARIKESFARRGLAATDGPDVAINAHSADPHYGTGSGPGAEIPREAVLLIDLWARVANEPEAPYADSTWMAWTGYHVPADVERIFEVTAASRDAAIEAIDRVVRAGITISGRQVDEIARQVVIEAGLEHALMHRTGHSLGSEHVHGNGTNLDSVEFPDDRPIHVGAGFTVEPGLYLPGKYGMRLEVSAILQPDGVEVTTEQQREMTRLLID